MSWRSDLENKYTVKCKYCSHEIIDPNRRPAQSYIIGACPSCGKVHPKPKQQCYKVYWIIDINADTPKQAAKIACEIMQDPSSTSLTFLIENEIGIEGTIDLLDNENKEEYW
jgi:hypothetical protein